MAELVHADITRMRELATIFVNAATDTTTITTDTSTPAVAASLTDSATSAACHEAASPARQALQTVADHYHTLHTGTRTSAEVYERTDAEHAARIDTVRGRL